MGKDYSQIRTPPILKTYLQYNEHTRTHLSLEKDAPISRTVQLPELGRVIELPQVGGLHHRYHRRPAEALSFRQRSLSAN